MNIRPATPDDADGIAAVLKDLVAAGKRTSQSDADFVLSHYITHPDSIECSVAVDEKGKILGIQSLRHAVIDNAYDVEPGWGIIGTHIHPSAARRGIGKALFRVTLAAAKSAKLPAIDATIGAQNAEGLAYYSAMGFQDYRTMDGAKCKRFDLG